MPSSALLIHKYLIVTCDLVWSLLYGLSTQITTSFPHWRPASLLPALFTPGGQLQYEMSGCVCWGYEKLPILKDVFS